MEISDAARNRRKKRVQAASRSGLRDPLSEVTKSQRLGTGSATQCAYAASSRLVKVMHLDMRNTGPILRKDPVSDGAVCHHLRMVCSGKQVATLEYMLASLWTEVLSVCHHRLGKHCDIGVFLAI